MLFLIFLQKVWTSVENCGKSKTWGHNLLIIERRM